MHNLPNRTNEWHRCFQLLCYHPLDYSFTDSFQVSSTHSVTCSDANPSSHCYF